MDMTKKLTKELTPEDQRIEIEIDRLIKSFNVLLERLTKETTMNEADKRKKYFEEITKARTQLQDFKKKSGEDADISAKLKLNTLLGSIEGLYSRRTGQSLPTPKKVSLVQSSTSIPTSITKEPLTKPDINSTSIVWFIALMLLL
jgi:hypothetical protein